jgi:DNA-directed RNA polymerase subunit RPC12/RpoP
MQETTETQSHGEEILLDIAQALVVRERYVCAGCWGGLNVYFSHSGPARVTCDYCGDGRGFVTKRFTDRRRQESRGEAIEVRELLTRIGVMPHVVRTAEELLAEIGQGV